MSNERDRSAPERAAARLREALASPGARRNPHPATSAAAGGKAQTERWKDGTPKVREQWLLELGADGKPFDEDRWHEDLSYQNKFAHVAEELLQLRHKRETAARVEEGRTAGGGQKRFEENREQIIADAKKAVIDREIDRLESRKSALEVSNE